MKSKEEVIIIIMVVVMFFIILVEFDRLDDKLNYIIQSLEQIKDAVAWEEFAK